MLTAAVLAPLPPHSSEPEVSFVERPIDCSTLHTPGVQSATLAASTDDDPAVASPLRCGPVGPSLGITESARHKKTSKSACARSEGSSTRVRAAWTARMAASNQLLSSFTRRDVTAGLLELHDLASSGRLDVASTPQLLRRMAVSASCAATNSRKRR